MLASTIILLIHKLYAFCKDQHNYNYYKNEKTFKNEQRNRDDAAKKKS